MYCPYGSGNLAIIWIELFVVLSMVFGVPIGQDLATSIMSDHGVDI